MKFIDLAFTLALLLKLVAGGRTDSNEDGNIIQEVLSIGLSGCYKPLIYPLADEELQNGFIVEETTEDDRREKKICWKDKGVGTIHHSHGMERMCDVNPRNILSVTICDIDMTEAKNKWYGLSTRNAMDGIEPKLEAKLEVKLNTDEGPRRDSATSKPDKPCDTTALPQHESVVFAGTNSDLMILILIVLVAVILLVWIVWFLCKQKKANDVSLKGRPIHVYCKILTHGTEEAGANAAAISTGPIEADPTKATGPIEADHTEATGSTKADSPQISNSHNSAEFISGVSNASNRSDYNLSVGSGSVKGTTKLNATVPGSDVRLNMEAEEEHSLNEDLPKTSEGATMSIPCESQDFLDPDCSTSSSGHAASSLEDTDINNFNLCVHGRTDFKRHVNDRGSGIRYRGRWRNGRGDGDRPEYGENHSGDGRKQCEQFKGGERGVGRGGDGVSGDKFIDDSKPNARRKQNGKKFAPVTNSDGGVKHGEQIQLLEIEGESCKRKKDAT